MLAIATGCKARGHSHYEILIPAPELADDDSTTMAPTCGSFGMDQFEPGRQHEQHEPAKDGAKEDDWSITDKFGPSDGSMSDFISKYTMGSEPKQDEPSVGSLVGQKSINGLVGREPELDSKRDDADGWLKRADLRKNWWSWSHMASRVFGADQRQGQAANLQDPAAERTPTPVRPQRRLPYIAWPAPPVATLNQTGALRTGGGIMANYDGGLKLKGRSEIEQQSQPELSMPIEMSLEGALLQPAEAEAPPNRPNSDDRKLAASMPGGLRIAPANRARESLLNAADIARQAQRRTPNATAQRVDTRSIESAAHQIDHQRTWPSFASGALEWDAEARYLGRGHLQKIEPFNGNMRTQARLSCQFGDSEAHNVTISVSDQARSDHPLCCLPAT